MELENINEDEFDIKTEKTLDQETFDDPYQQSSNKSSMPMIAGILFIISGVVAILFWLSAIATFDIAISMMDLSQYQELYPNLTQEEIEEMVIRSAMLCGTISSILSTSESR